jgi:serine/threonine-protein kinase
MPSAAAPKAPVLPSLRERLQAALVERYEILRELPRREGTTRCFAARDLQHHRTVILKVLHPSLASAIDLQRFLREIAFTARLNHPHIVPLLDSSQVAGQPWYAVPDLQGEPLRELMARQGKPERRWVIELVADLAEALGYAHREGIVHRDVRPETIVLAGRQGLLGNFGVSAALEAAADTRLTLSGVLVGAPAYASPEQMVGASPAPASDVYSLGVVLYELLIGEPPFSGPTTHAILAKRAAAPPGWELRPELPVGIRETLRRMLAEEPGRRPAAPDVASALRMSPDQVEPARGHRLLGVVDNLFKGLGRRFRPGG